MKKFYRKRSDLVHKGIKNITDIDIVILEADFNFLVYRLIRMTSKYNKMEEKSHEKDKEGIDDYIKKWKFYGLKCS
jgi:hypothetical protein